MFCTRQGPAVKKQCNAANCGETVQCLLYKLALTLNELFQSASRTLGRRWLTDEVLHAELIVQIPDILETKD